MSHKVVTLELVRDGQCTPWGFRLYGGADIQKPLSIMKINFGSPSEGELQKDDIILSINGNDARKMSHQRASEVILKAGNTLKLVLARSTGPLAVSPALSPTSSPFIAPLLSQTGNTEYFKPLPRTELNNGGYRTSSPSQQRPGDEKIAIANQAYRTLPLITPGLKASKDCPVGSYLRFSRDTSGRPPAHNTDYRQNDPYMLTKVQEAILEAALSSPRASVSSSRTSTPDIGYQNISLKQYNSPINLYSQQAVVETIKAQTSGTTKHLERVQRIPSPVDLSKSPTYQLIREQEWKNLNKKDLKEHQPVQNKVHNLEEVPRSEFGSSDAIHQSGSFKTLMATLKTTPSV